MPTAHSVDTLAQRLHATGQGHLAQHLSRASEADRRSLEAQLNGLDLEHLAGLVKGYVLAKPAADLGAKIEPVPYYQRKPAGDRPSWDRDAFFAKGVELIRAGKVAAFTVAGGQGSRLGYEGPKGCYPGGAVSNKPLFACLADWILSAQERWCAPGVTIPWYVMTSPGNHAATVEFFERHGHFGLRKADVFFFSQGVMPAFDMTNGRMLLESPGSLALSPDGHGGSLRALMVSGAVADMKRRGVRLLSYTQIDNPLVRVIDPVFLGLHAAAGDSSGEMSSKMVPKASATEKVGVLCRVDGKTAVIEYSDLPKELSERADAAGQLAFNAGSIAVHVLSVEFLEKVNGVSPGATAGGGGTGGGLTLPWHRAEKKVPFWSPETGQRVEPSTPNAVKLEAFVFDALPLCRSSIVLETDRVEEFAPIKNATGGDSPATCKQIQTLRASRWLESVGSRVPYDSAGHPHCTLEINPRTAAYPQELRGHAKTPAVVAAGASLVL